MTPVVAIVVKELRLLLRDPGGLLLLFLLPAVFIVVLSVALQGAFSSDRAEDRLSIVVVDEGGGEVASSISEQVAASGLFQVRREGDLGIDAARAGLEAGRWDVVVRVPAGAEEALAGRGEATVEVLLDPVVSIEVARAAEAAVREATLVASLDQARGALAKMRGAEPSEGRSGGGLAVEQAYLGGGGRSPRPNSVQQNVPGWTIFALFWIAQILAVNILGERESGIYGRIRAAPISMPLYLVGKLIPFLGINLLQAVAMFAVGALLLPHLGCPRLVITDVPALTLVTLAISMVAVSFGLLMASLTRSTFFVASATAALLIIMTVVGGIMVPRFVMPEVLQQASLAVPHGWALEAYHEILVRDGSTRDVLPHAGVLVGFAAAMFAAALARMRLSRR